MGRTKSRTQCNRCKSRAFGGCCRKCLKYFCRHCLNDDFGDWDEVSYSRLCFDCWKEVYDEHIASHKLKMKQSPYEPLWFSGLDPEEILEMFEDTIERDSDDFE